MQFKKFLIIALSFLCCYCVRAQDRKISITANDKPIKEIFSRIQDLSGYNIIYSDEVVLDTMRASVTAKNETVPQIMNLILTPRKLYYTLLDKQLLIISSSELKNKDSLISRALTGSLIDDNKQPVVFATVQLLDSSEIKAATITDKNGAFTLHYFFKDSIEYKLNLSCIGYNSRAYNFKYIDSLNSIIMQRDKNSMPGVTVTSTRPFIEMLADRYIVNVENSSLADGNNALEVLQRTPGVWLDNNDRIHINGANSVLVMIDNVVQRMSSSELSDYLRMIKSENIKKIEIIPNPPAEYEASGTGGIIHIILKKSRNDGVNAIITNTYKQQEKQPYESPGIFIDYKKSKLYLYGNASYNLDRSDYTYKSEVNYNDTSMFNSVGSRHNNNKSFRTQIGTLYELNTSQSLGLQGSISSVNNVQSFLTNIQLKNQNGVTNSDADALRKKRSRFKNGTLTYSNKIDSIGSEFKIIADYIRSNNEENNYLVTNYYNPSSQNRRRNNTPNVTDIYSAQADLSKNFTKNFKFNIGFKYIASKRDNAVNAEKYLNDQWTMDNSISNRFIYNENLLMGYISADKSLKTTSFKLGLRAEESFVKGNSITLQTIFKRKYLDLFPSFFVMQYLSADKKNFLNFSYSRRIRRPQYNELNPYEIYFSDYSVLKGNPDLLPEYSDNLQVRFAFLKKFQFSAYYGFTKNVISQLMTPLPNNVIEEQQANFNKGILYGANLFAPLNIAKWWTNNIYLESNYSAYNYNNYSQDKPYYSAFISSTISLPKNYEINFSNYYTAPHVEGILQWSSLYICYFNLKKKLFNDKLKLQLSVDDVFNTFSDKYNINYSGIKNDFYQKRPTRKFGLTVSYNFSSGIKFKTKKVEQSNEDEKSRL